MSLRPYKIWTDGSYKSSINQGGYSAIITEKIHGKRVVVKKLYQGFKNTTNNRMELMGVLEALRWFKDHTNMIIYSDSQYVVNSINNKHVDQWIKINDQTKKNMDLWIQIWENIQRHNVKFQWVKGHNKDEFNEIADMYACHAAECIDLEFDLNYN